MTMDIAIHPRSQETISVLSKDLPQSLLLAGPRGVGLGTIANRLAASSLMAELFPLDAKGEINANAGLISVEMIRRLYEQTRAKHTTRQVVLIHDANRMSTGAQAAFLKLLEEPNPHIHFLLTSHIPQKLLPTIRSRVKTAVLHPITEAQTKQLITKAGITDTKKQAQLEFIAGGLPAELTRLISDEVYFNKQAGAISDARDFLQGSPYEKLRIIQSYKADREKSVALIDNALHILRRSLSSKPQQRIVSDLNRLLQIRENLLSNYSVSLQLAQFAL